MIRVVFTFFLIWIFFLGSFYVIKRAQNKQIISWFKFGMSATAAAFLTTTLLFIFVILF